MANAESEVVAGGQKPDRTEKLGRGLGSTIAALVGKPWFWVVGIGGLFLVLLVSALGRRVPAPPSKKYELPAFSLLNERGERVSNEDLKGRIWVADFIFTSCAGPCPNMTKRMGEIQHRTRNMGDAIHLVTFTVDPENDTPDVLAAYAQKHRANPRKWSFVTGPVGDIEALAVKGFKLATTEGSARIAAAHSERLVLVDSKGWIRGYYEPTDEGVSDLLHDAGVLANVPEAVGG